MVVTFNQIPIDLINECNKKHEETNITHLILDVSDKAKIYRLKGNKSGERETKIDSILDTQFEVVSWYDLMDMPSRQTFYDSVTKHTDIFERHKIVLNFLNSIDFYIADLLESGFTQQELLFNLYTKEVAYVNGIIIIRVKQNLMCEISIMNGNNVKKHFFFYNPNQILNIVFENSGKIEKRNLKIEHLLDS